MSMHLVGPYMTTTNYKKRKQKNITKRDRQAQADHDKWLRKMGVHPEQLATKEKQSVHSIPDYTTDSRSLPTSDRIDGHCPQKSGNKYTGDYIIGIATTHKSNLMPVTSKKQAVEASTMRRN